MKRTRKRTKPKTKKRLSSNMHISEKTYQKLLSMKKRNKRLSKHQKRSLEKALHYKYCDCIKKIRYSQKNPAAYGICAKSVYLNRDIEMPKRAALNCSKLKLKKNLKRTNKKRKTRRKTNR